MLCIRLPIMLWQRIMIWLFDSSIRLQSAFISSNLRTPSSTASMAMAMQTCGPLHILFMTADDGRGSANPME